MIRNDHIHQSGKVFRQSQGAKPGHLFLLTILVLVCPYNLQAQSTITSAQTGAWDVGTTWIGGSVPLATDNAIIQSGHTVSLATGSGESINALTIEAGAVLDARNKTFSVSGKMIVDGTCTTDENSAKDLSFSGDSMGGGGNHRHQ